MTEEKSTDVHRCQGRRRPSGLVLTLILATVPAVVFLAQPHLGWADLSKDAGTGAFAFLKIPFSARTVALGEAPAATDRGVESIFVNPAGAAGLDGRRVTFSYAGLLAGLKGGAAAVAGPTSSLGTLSLTAIYISYGSVRKSSGSDPTGEVSGSFTPSELSVALGWHKEVMGFVSTGVLVKAVSSSMEEYSARGVAVDVGAQFRTKFLAGTEVGAVVRNIGKQTSSYGDKSDNLPLYASCGVGINVIPRVLVLVCDLRYARDDGPGVGAGLEYLLGPVAALQMGYSRILSETGEDGLGGARGLSGGVGFKQGRLAIDFAAESKGDIGLVTYVSASLGF